MIFINDLLGRNTLFHGPDGNRYTVFITSPDKKNIFFLRSLIAHINICGNIAAGQMTDMDGAICIGKCGSNQDAVVFFHSLKAEPAPQGLQKYVKEA